MRDWRTIFIGALRSHGMETTAANQAGVSLRRVKREIEDNEEFSHEVQEALEASADMLEAEARRRAVEGIEKGVYFKGVKVDVETQYSDTLLAQLLKGRRASVFGDKREVNLTGGATVNVVVRQFSRDNDGNVIEAKFTPLNQPTQALTVDDFA